MNINEAFEKFVEVNKLHYGDNVRYEARCTKGLFSVDAPSPNEALREAKHYFRQYFEDGEYEDEKQTPKKEG